MNRLTLSLEPSNEPDDLSLLSVVVTTPEFSGRARTWTWPEIFEDFAKSLAAYPILADAPAELRVGFGRSEDKEDEVYVRLIPADRRGTISVEVDLSDYLDTKSRLRIHFTTHYTDVQRFQRQRSRLAAGETTEAVLYGS